MARKVKKEVLDIVDNKDFPVGEAPIEEIYSKKLTHRIVHIFLLNPNQSEIYLQRRAMTKSFLPGYYCTSAGGHVHSGETYIQAARRELEEELGIRCRLKLVNKFTYTDNNHSRKISLFIAQPKEKKINFLDGEVMDGKFLPMNKVGTMISTNQKIHPQLKACFNVLVQKQKV